MSADDPPPPDSGIPESLRTRENKPLTEALARATLEHHDDVTTPGAPAYQRVAESLRPPAGDPPPWIATITRVIDAWTKGERLLALILAVALAILIVGFVVGEVSGSAVLTDSPLIAAFGGPRGLFSRLIVWLAMVGLSIAVARVERRGRPRLAALILGSAALLGFVIAFSLGGDLGPDVSESPVARASAVTHEGVFRFLLLVISAKLGLRAIVTAGSPAAR